MNSMSISLIVIGILVTINLFTFFAWHKEAQTANIQKSLADKWRRKYVRLERALDVEPCDGEAMGQIYEDCDCEHCRTTAVAKVSVGDRVIHDSN